jgi:hypothetical protein
VFAAATTILIQLLILATSNHNFINLLTILLCLFLLDDRIVGALLPSARRYRQLDLFRPGFPSVRVPSGAAAVLILAISVTQIYPMVTRRNLPPALYAFATLGPRYGIGNVYHVFPTMQTERQELRIAGSYDGVNWQPYVFRYKPDALDKAPAFIVPHQPRLDWMMWFVPPQRRDMEPWFTRFIAALADNQPAITHLLAGNPFEGRAPPRYLRVDAYRYRFTTPKERAESGNWWKAEYLGEFPDVAPRRP